MSSTSPTQPAFSAFLARRRDAFGLPQGPRLLLPDPDDHGTGQEATGGQGGSGGSGSDAGTGGSGGAGTGSGSGQGTQGTPGGSGGSGGQGAGADRGFPENTPLTEMTVDQREAYWKYQARKHEERANQRSDYDAVKAKAEQWDAHQRAQQTPSEQAVEQAREAGKTEALATANRTAVQGILQTALVLRGKTAEQATELLAHTNFESFVKDGAPDTDAIVKHIDSIAGPVTGGGGRGPDHGQGRRGSGGKATGVGAGREMFAESRPNSKTTTTP